MLTIMISWRQRRRGYTATQADINAGDDLVNTASVVTDQVSGPTEASATTTIDKNPSLTINKAVDQSVISAPGVLNYTITLSNTGNVDLTGVVLSDAFADSGASLTSGDANNNDILETTETWVYSATYTATQADINAGDDLVNTASVVTDQVPGPTEASATTTIDQNPSLTINKAVDQSVISAPGVLNYTITVSNTGNVDLTGVVMSDAFADSGASLTSGDAKNNDILETTETWVYSATYTATQADINAGVDLVNTAS